MTAPPVVHELLDRLWDESTHIERIWWVAMPGPVMYAGQAGNVRIRTPGKDGKWLRETRPPPGAAWSQDETYS